MCSRGLLPQVTASGFFGDRIKAVTSYPCRTLDPRSYEYVSSILSPRFGDPYFRCGSRYGALIVPGTFVFIESFATEHASVSPKRQITLMYGLLTLDRGRTLREKSCMRLMDGAW